MDEDEEEGEEEEKTARSGEKHVRELTNENLDYVKNQIKQVSLAKLEETKTMLADKDSHSGEEIKSKVSDLQQVQ